jgi:hypothetical protein
MRPGPDAIQPTQIRERETAQSLVSLSEEQRSLLAVLRTQQNGMTLRQLETTLSAPGEGVQSLLETLLERQLVAQLNTIVPSYVYRYGGPDPGVW